MGGWTTLLWMIFTSFIWRHHRQKESGKIWIIIFHVTSVLLQNTWIFLSDGFAIDTISPKKFKTNFFGWIRIWEPAGIYICKVSNKFCLCRYRKLIEIEDHSYYLSLFNGGTIDGNTDRFYLSEVKNWTIYFLAIYNRLHTLKNCQNAYRLSMTSVTRNWLSLKSKTTHNWKKRHINSSWDHSKSNDERRKTWNQI